MKKLQLIWFLFIIFVMISPLAYSAENYDKAVSDAVIDIMKELKYSNQLKDRRIAIYGFRDAVSTETCKELTRSLDNKVTAIVHQIKNFSDIPFSIVARGELDAVAIGDEYGPMLLELSDILITGTWRNSADYLTLTIKALKKKGTAKITSKVVKVDKHNLDSDLINCLGTVKGKLYVNPTPDNASIRILNHKLPFKQGIMLESGRYQLEVTFEGCKDQTQWISIKSGENKRVHINLEPLPDITKVSKQKEFKRLLKSTKFRNYEKVDPDIFEDAYSKFKVSYKGNYTILIKLESSSGGDHLYTAEAEFNVCEDIDYVIFYHTPSVEIFFNESLCRYNFSHKFESGTRNWIRLESKNEYTLLKKIAEHFKELKRFCANKVSIN